MNTTIEGTDGRPRPIKRPAPSPETVAAGSYAQSGVVTAAADPSTQLGGGESALASAMETTKSQALTLDGQMEPVFQAGFVRKPFGVLDQKLSAPSRPGFHRHWFNDPLDRPGRIEEANAAGYSHVRDKNGRPVNRNVGRGGLKAYLMEIRQEWFDADMDAQERENKKIDAAIRAGTVAKKPDDDTRYVPKSGIRLEDE